MTDHAVNGQPRSDGRSSLINDPTFRAIIVQAVTFVVLVFVVWSIVDNTIANLQKANIASGFGFLAGRAGFDISQTMIHYTNDSTYGRALLVGLVNTVMIAVFGIATATIVGFIIGLARLSKNWLISTLATVYVEIFRNIPVLLVIFFLYKGVLAALPLARNSLHLPLSIYLNNRGLVFPRAIWGDGSTLAMAAFLLALVLAIGVRIWAKKRQMRTGKPFPTGWTALALIVGLPVLVFAALGWPLSFDYPVQGKFNLTGGTIIRPEFVAIYLALSLYTAAFIAEVIRAGIKGVPKGQTEAAEALGLHHNTTTRLVVVPQAMRIIIPPLTSEYLNLTKNTSLAVAVGFPDLVSVGGTILNQTGQAVEVVTIWLVVYLTTSLLTSLFMNWFNAKMALVER
ncbi:amino acid ABC transporter permease [Allorhizobium sp. BGMRC 0089]|uniref:amino acid ABC transporter permease n=1 Tax=Allorhizobium sonneratiae TaxID=2934936 RepID=UPI0020341388|nr:amino acid ABC transporter permease [Allorhizobium sonneratiae]MCM2292989.1 amino acid ABC transporter permease [Allorhizobium sonneratiae]